jgi:hypothetical protein
MSDSETNARENESQERYDLYLYNLPNLDENKKPIAIAPLETRMFPALEDARRFAEERRQDFDRVALIKTMGETQQLVQRFRDGELQQSGSGQMVRQ